MQWLFVNYHPVDAEAVAALAETVGKEGFGDGHETLAALDERRIDALGLLVAVD